MTVIMLDAREQYDAECNRRGMPEAQRETENIFGFDDVEYADDSNFIRMNLPCLRILQNFILSKVVSMAWKLMLISLLSL